MSNRHNNNKHDADAPPQDELANSNTHGELRNGRLSIIKNSSPDNNSRENEYLSEKTDDR
ncbi:MAG: hypothetical protein K0Q59_3811 [Paenibacillus sp.]|nr:hypothetical protein [Paenibacillus sp.]